MKFTLSWLKEFLDTTASVEEISETLTAIGLEVESVENRGEALKSFTVAEILAAEKHPDADKLQVCTVRTHDGERQIVCGAPNARAGIKVALADIGVTIPRDGFTIKKAQIRGVESSGMLCSADELGLGEDSAGIIELPEEATVGDSIVKDLGLDDVLFDIAITPNRGDCLGVYGIARDLAAAGLGRLKVDNIEPVAGTGPAGRKIQLKTDDCKMFVGRLIKGVKNEESPTWLKRRLESVGLRPISALVDITNYMTMAYGRPLHVYDADKLHGDIIVRDSVDGEAIEGLNDKSYTLPAGLCVIADEQEALGLGGVVGGVPSGVTEATKNVFLEAAWFEPVAIARTGRALSVDSDARYRFERTVDPEFVIPGAELATRMIISLCGGEASELEIAGSAPDLTRSIAFDPHYVAELGGITVSDEEASDALEALGCTIEMQGDAWQVTTPGFRPDIEGRADLVEEILRLRSYDAIPEVPLPEGRGAAHGSGEYDRALAVKRALAVRGLQECYHFAFNARAEAELFTDDADALIPIINPISTDLDTMRPRLLAGLLGALRRNDDRGIEQIALCEVGVVFDGMDANSQPLHAACVRVGTGAQHWSAKPHSWDVYDIKADLEAALAATGFSGKAQVSAGAAPWYHPGKSGQVKLGKQVLGQFGALHPAVLRVLDIEQEVLAFELNLDAVPKARQKATRKALRLSDFQESKRDFAFVIDASVEAEALLGAVRGAEKQLLRDVTLFDVYAGKGVPEGKKSLAVSVTLQADNRTLSEEDLKRVSDAIITAAQTKCGAELR